LNIIKILKFAIWLIVISCLEFLYLLAIRVEWLMHILGKIALFILLSVALTTLAIYLYKFIVGDD